MRNDDQVFRDSRRARAGRSRRSSQQEQARQRPGPAMAQSAKLLSETDVNGTSALNRLLQTQGGGGAPIQRL
jgi:hypothetical protein